MQTTNALTVCLVALWLTTAVVGDADPGTSHGQDHVYAKYAIKYLGLGDYTQQTSPGSKANPVFHTVPDQNGFTKYITYTSDGSSVYEVTVQIKPGSYPVIWSTPIKSKTGSGDNEVGAIAEQSKGSKDENAVEEELPLTFPPDVSSPAEEMSGHGGNLDETSTEQPTSHNGHHDSSGGRSPSSGPAQEDNSRQRPAQVVRPQYFPGHYGATAVSFYPVAYNPFTGQVKYVARPVSASGGVAQQGAEKVLSTLQPYTTTTRPSPIPLGITGSSLRVPYLYPYMTYQPKANSRVLYQVPTQQINAIPSPIVQWVQAVPATRYQASFPQGYVSYQHGVSSGQYLSALQSSQPSGQSAMVQKLSAMQTKSSSETPGQ